MKVQACLLHRTPPSFLPSLLRPAGGGRTLKKIITFIWEAKKHPQRSADVEFVLSLSNLDMIVGTSMPAAVVVVRGGPGARRCLVDPRYDVMYRCTPRGARRSPIGRCGRIPSE